MKKITLLFLFFAGVIFGQDSLYFLIRVDDIQSRNTVMLPKSITQFQNAVNSRGGKVTWLVIPHRLIEDQNLDGVLSKELKASALLGNEIAQHGYNHICPVCSNTGHEMFCAANSQHVSYQTQINLISQGLKILSDSLNITPKLFVPPGHACDTVTYQALLDKGIPFLSSTGNTKAFIYKNLFNVMQNTEFTWQLTSAGYNNELHLALQDIRLNGAINGYYCLLLHDPFIRQGYENGIVVKWIGELLDSLNIEYAGRIKYKTLSQAASIYRSNITDVVENGTTSPLNFSLSQNYPNPFNPTTTIGFSLSSAGYTTVKIYDILGKETAELVNGYLTAGSHYVTWDAKNRSGFKASNGIYFAKLSSGSNVKVIKMVLLK